MPFSLWRAAARSLPLLAALALAPSALAATQTKDDAAGEPSFNYNGDRLDLRQVSWDVTAEMIHLDLTMTAHPSGAPFFVFLDTNKDGKSDYAVEGYSGHGDGTQIKYRLKTTPSSAPGCQRVDRPGQDRWGSQTLAEASDAFSGMPVGDAIRYRISWAPALTGNVTSFDWAVYASTFDIFHNRFDYMPDAANYDVARPNPVTTVKDYCDDNGDGEYGDSDADGAGPDTGDEHDSEFGSVPLVMANGFSFPDQNDGGGGDGGGDGDGDGGGADQLVNPTDTSRNDVALPKLTGLRVQQARERALKALGYASFTINEIYTAKPGKGIGFGDVISQTPKPNTKLDSGIGQLPAIKLDIYAGPRPKGAKDCLDKLAKDAKGLEMALAADLLKKAGCRISYNFKLGGGETALVSKVTPKTADRVEVAVTVPRSPLKHDLFLTFRESPNQLSFAAEDWALTADDRARNFITMQVLDRAGRFVNNARIQIDTSDAKGQDPSEAVTRGKGEVSTSFLVPSAGKLDVIVYTVGDNDVAVYGAAQLAVKQRKLKPGQSYLTTSGRKLTFTKSGGWSDKTAGPVALGRAGAETPLERFVNWMKGLLGGYGAAPQTLAKQDLSAQQKLRLVGNGPNGTFPAVLATGGQVVSAGSMNLIGTASGNAVAAGGGNLIGAAGGNLIGPAAGNLVTAASNGVVAAGSGNIIGHAGGNLISQAQGSGLIDAAKSNVIDIGEVKLLSDNGLGLVSDNGLGVVAAGGGNAIAFNHAGVVSAGGGN